MKNFIAVLVMGLFLIPAPTYAAFDADLRYGSSGAEVFELQEFLTAQGVYTGPITGNFYSLTLAAVKAFQSKENVSPASGFFGPLTRAKANTLLSAELEESDKEASTTPEVVTPDKPRRTTSSNTSTGDSDDDFESVPSYSPTVSVTAASTSVTFVFSGDEVNMTELNLYNEKGVPGRSGQGKIINNTMTYEHEFEPGLYNYTITMIKVGPSGTYTRRTPGGASIATASGTVTVPAE